MTTNPPGHPFAHGAIVILYLQEPREKIWGQLLDLNPAGVSILGLGLDSFDDWLRGLMEPEDQRIHPSMGFYPLLRVEKILLDEGTEGIPSLDAQVVARTGAGLKEHLARLSAPETLKGSAS